MTKGKSEKIVIVDDHDVVIGEEEKEKCHDGEGLLHRGLLSMVFTEAGELLLARRSDKKRLWPGFWDGTVASHLLKEEDYLQASERILRQELGLTASEIEYAFRFRYKAHYLNVGVEHEICAVTIIRGVAVNSLVPDTDEIDEVRSANFKNLIQEVMINKAGYTPWLILALEHISERPMTYAEEIRVPKVFC